MFTLPATALAALAATGAFAQSSVTISGNLSMGYLQSNARTAGGGLTKTTTIGAMDTTNANRITLTAVEDLGGGLKFTGVIDNRLTPNNGARNTGDMYAQVAGDFGTIKAGQYTFASNAGYNAGVANAVSAVATTTQALGGQVLSYTTPNFSGLTVSAGVELDSTGGGVGKDGFGLKVNYASGPLAAQLAYSQAPRKTATGTGAKVTSLAGSYDLGVAKLYYTQSDVRAGTVGAAAGYGPLSGSGSVIVTSAGTDLSTRKGNALSVGIPVGAATIKAGYMNNKIDATSAAGYDRAMIGIDYALSKRTVLVAEVGQDKQAVTGADRATNTFVGVWHTF